MKAVLAAVIVRDSRAPRAKVNSAPRVLPRVAMINRVVDEWRVDSTIAYNKISTPPGNILEARNEPTNNAANSVAADDDHHQHSPTTHMPPTEFLARQARDLDREVARKLDLDFWRAPEGVRVPEDELSFLLVPDAVVGAACFDLAKQVHAYQAECDSPREQISRALMVTMGGLLPSVVLYDHLVEGRGDNLAAIQFGTIGLSLYKGPGERYKNPRIRHGISISIDGCTVLVIDDLGDEGGTMQFLAQYVKQSGAHKVLNLAMYMKPKALATIGADFYFGETPQHTWIITPRERIETLVKRVPVWKSRGASQAECRRRLVELIGYRESEVDYYLPLAFARDAST